VCAVCEPCVYHVYAVCVPMYVCRVCTVYKYTMLLLLPTFVYLMLLAMSMCRVCTGVYCCCKRVCAVCVCRACAVRVITVLLLLLMCVCHVYAVCVPCVCAVVCYQCKRVCTDAADNVCVPCVCRVCAVVYLLLLKTCVY